MAPGYVIALLLEAAGLAGLVLALAVLRAEERARAAELRLFLKSGQSGRATPGPVSRQRRRGPSARPADLPVTLVRQGAAVLADSAARAALHRVLRPR